MKHAELATLDTYLLKAKVQELEGTITGKDNIISLLKNQASLSLKEIGKLRQISPQSASTDIPPLSQSEKRNHDTPLHSHLHLTESGSSPATQVLSSSSSQTSFNAFLSYKTNSHLENETIDHNSNMPLNTSTEKSPATGSDESFPNLTHDGTKSYSQHSSPGTSHSKNAEKFCIGYIFAFYATKLGSGDFGDTKVHPHWA